MPSISLNINVEETTYEAPTQWRMLGAEGKAGHIMALCANNELVPETVLEVGAGDGAILACLGEKFFCKAMHAVEISQSGVQVILGQHVPGLISCQTFNGYNLPFKDDSFDLVILSHVLEHVEFERALLREVRRVSEYQLIEIPMDFPALENDNFQLLGPSYGHINAHSAASLRFLLSTENFVVLDGMLGQYTLAVQEYDYFINNSREKTPDAIRTFRACFEREKKAFEDLPLAQQERRASFYAVLTRKESAKEGMARAINAAKSYISSGQVQAARLIFKHYIPNAKEVEASLDIARFCLQSHHRQAAQEFVDRVLKIEGSNLGALEIMTALQVESVQHTQMPSSDANAHGGLTVDILRQWLKMKFPHLVRAVRKVRK
jgi:ubiquinone/menaquinone biosynthesis C-methylase UbiE